MLLTQACLTSSISITFTEDGLSDAQKDIKKIQKDLVRTDNEHLAISNKLTECRKQNAIMLERLLQLDTYIRRENLKFSGVSEGQNEVPQDKVRDILKDQLAIDSSETMDFQRCHRMGYKPENRKFERDIIVRFTRFEDRETVWKNRRKLSGTAIIMKEDFPKEVEQRRIRMYPIMKAAHKENKKAQMVGDKLIIEGRRYSFDSLDSLPASLQLSNLSTRVLDNTVLFFGKDSYLSNFYPTQLILNGKTFSGPEQFYEYQKALKAGDYDIAAKIMSTDNPIEQMRYGRELQLNEEQWSIQTALDIIETAVTAKFNQHPNLRKKLLDTGKRTIAECNAHDKFWSSGVGLYNENAQDKLKWTGKNYLGDILCKVISNIK